MPSFFPSWPFFRSSSSQKVTSKEQGSPEETEVQNDTAVQKEAELETGFLRSVQADRSLPFPLAAIPGALPRHRFELPSDPLVDQQPLGPGAQLTAESSEQDESRSITNPVYTGFMFSIGVCLALVLAYCVLNVGALAGWLTGALFIGLGLDPAVRKLEEKGLPRSAGVALIFLLFAALATTVIFWVIPLLARQAMSFITGFPQEFERFLDSDFFTALDQRFQIRDSIDAEVEHFFSSLTSDSSIISNFMNSLVNAGSTLAQAASGIVIVLFLAVYLLAALPTIKIWFIRLAPASRRERVGYLTEKITSSVGQYVLGQGLVALFNASFAALVMLLVQVPFAQLLMLFVLILAFIPLVGGVSAALLVSLVALTDSWQTALFFLIPYLIYLQVEAYFISPRIMSRAVAVPGALAIIAVVAGSALWGVLGAIIAIPVAASLLILVNEVFVPHQDRR